MYDPILKQRLLNFENVGKKNIYRALNTEPSVS